MSILRKIIKITLVAYLIYIFVFSVLIYSFNRFTGNQNTSDEFSVPYTNNNTNDRISLIESPEDGFSVRLSLIENAKTHLDLAYYKFVDGQVSEIILGSILDAADRGVKVRILLDGFIQLGNLGGKVNNIFLGFESHPNIEINLYEPFNPLLPLSWNNRLHDKIILVDKTFALLGGRNIEDRFYLEEIYGDELVQDRDVLIYHEVSSATSLNDISSSVIEEMQDYYNLLWQHKYSKPKYKNLSNRNIEKGKVFIDELRLKHPTLRKRFLETHFENIQTIDWAERTLPTDSIHFVSNALARIKQNPRCLKAILQLSSDAKESIFIQSPYIIPSKSMRSLFSHYEIDIEKITLFTNSKVSSPNILAFSAYENYKQKIIDNKIRIYEYQGPGSIHAKTSMFDEHISVVGTFNIDSRSSYLSTESMVIIDSKPFADILRKEIQEKLDYSLEIDKDYSYIENKDLPLYPVPKIKKSIINILSKITPFIEHLL